MTERKVLNTDVESGDYVLEQGAKRNFEALKTAEEQEAKAAEEEEEELKNNPMKLLEKRTEQSRREMDMIEILEDLQELNKRQAGMEADHILLRKLWDEKSKKEKEKEDEDEEFIKNALLAQKQMLPKSNPQVIEEYVHELPSFTSLTSNPNLSSQMKRLPKPFAPKELPMTAMKRKLAGAIVRKIDSSSSVSADSTAGGSVGHDMVPKLSSDSIVPANNQIDNSCDSKKARLSSSDLVTLSSVDETGAASSPPGTSNALGLACYSSTDDSD